MTKEQMRSIVGKNIRRARIARKMTVDELAEVLDLTSGYVGLIERGRRGSSALNLFKLSSVLDVGVDEFFYDADNDYADIDPTDSKRKLLYCLTSNMRERELGLLVEVTKSLKEVYPNQAAEADAADSD